MMSQNSAATLTHFFPQNADSARWKKQAVDSQIHRLFWGGG
jgi:hypothetical protein